MKSEQAIANLRYPIGEFTYDAEGAAQNRRKFINDLDELPEKLRAAIAGLSAEQLKTQYRTDGWTLEQVVHHLADSHMNSFARFKFALTEKEFTIKTYQENLWAELPDAKDLSPEISLRLLTALHERWIVLLESLTDADFSRTITHPEYGAVSLDFLLALYSWHSRHHTAHINDLRSRNGW